MILKLLTFKIVIEHKSTSLLSVKLLKLAIIPNIKECKKLKSIYLMHESLCQVSFFFVDVCQPSLIICSIQLRRKSIYFLVFDHFTS